MKIKFTLSHWRINAVRVVFLLCGFFVVVRLFNLQVLGHEYFLAEAEKQHWIEKKISAKRGRILSSDGSVLAFSEEGYLVYAVPQEVEKVEETADQLAGLLSTECDFCSLSIESSENKDGKADMSSQKEEKFKELKNLLSDRTKHWVSLARKISLPTYRKILELNLPGIYFEKENLRVYPEGELAAHALGFVGSDAKGEEKGYFGLEGYYDGDLAGRAGWEILEKDASGKPIPIGKISRVEPAAGRDIVLTINRHLQYLLEQKIKDGVEKYQAESGTFILMEPQTGKVLAMGNYPTFWPQYWQRSVEEEVITDVEVFKNLAISENYEPGSVLKSVTMSAALDSGAVSEEDTFNDLGPLKIQGYDIRTWDNRYHGVISMVQILQLSNNTGAAWVAQKTGQDTFLEYVGDFRLGKKTEIDLEGEDEGIVKSKDTWKPIDLATAAFGQGIALTPIQLATVFATIANGGIMPRPYVVEKVLTENKEIVNSPHFYGKVISPETAFKMQKILRSVVEEGEFKWFVKEAGLEHFDLAGKTGTAQIPEGGRYHPSKTQVTFVGFAPTHNPKFVLLVKLKEPTTSRMSANTAVPLWLEMVKELLINFKIGPTQ